MGHNKTNCGFDKDLFSGLESLEKYEKYFWYFLELEHVSNWANCFREKKEPRCN